MVLVFLLHLVIFTIASSSLKFCANKNKNKLTKKPLDKPQLVKKPQQKRPIKLPHSLTPYPQQSTETKKTNPQAIKVVEMNKQEHQLAQSHTAKDETNSKERSEEKKQPPIEVSKETVGESNKNKVKPKKAIELGKEKQKVVVVEEQELPLQKTQKTKADAETSKDENDDETLKDIRSLENDPNQPPSNSE
ncbi:hypothetical protein M3Y95_00979300 [Aphelenchoides besseyi]|nr:hypothetical protein M3Y95_00979300 [Aphelenchoides besseyi]